MPRRAKPRTPDQIRRETARLYAAKGSVLRDIKAIGAAAKPKPRKRTVKPVPAGIRMGG